MIDLKPAKRAIGLYLDRATGPAAKRDARFIAGAVGVESDIVGMPLAVFTCLYPVHLESLGKLHFVSAMLLERFKSFLFGLLKTPPET